MKSGMVFRLFKTGVFFLFLGWCPAQAAEFTADLIVTTPGSKLVYDLKVKGNLYRIEKVKGSGSIPSLPTIYNSETRVSWGLNPGTHQYSEETDPAKTMMMNPIAGWETMRNNLKALPGKAQKKPAMPLPAVTKTLKGQAPWGRRINAGGKLQVKFDPKLPIKIIFLNQGNRAARCTYTTYKKGDDHTPVKTGHIAMTQKGQRKKLTLSQNKQTERVVIQGEQGLIYASMVNEKNPFSFDSYALQNGYLTVKGAQGISVSPERKLVISVSGDSQDSPDSEICLICYHQQYKDKVFEEKIKIANNQTKTWTFSPDQKIQTCEILMGKIGGIKYRVEQPALPK